MPSKWREPLPRLYAIADASFGDPVEIAQALIRGGARLVQVRNKNAGARVLLDQVERILAFAPSDARIVVNDRIDVALAVGADGVQLGARGLPVGVARELVGDLSIGVSVHSIESAVQVEAEGADWITFGHVFPTASHPDVTPRGVAALAQAVQAVHVPVIAIGGIGTRQAGPVIQAGAAGIAVMSAILDAQDPARATAELRQACENAVGGRR